MNCKQRSKRMRLYLASTLLVAISLTTTASAQDYSRSGAYVGAAVGVGIEDFDGIPPWVDTDPGFGVTVTGGYRIIPTLAVELELENIIDLDIDGYELDALSFGANAKAFVLTDRVQPFLLFGLGLTHWDGAGWSDTEFSVRFGGGLDFYLSENVSVGAKASYVMIPDGSLEDMNYISVMAGAQYRF